MPKTTYTTKVDEMLDDIVYGYYGSTENRLVEQVLEANPGLENEKNLLTPGLVIVLPNIATTTAPPVLKQIKLWD